MTDLRLLHVVDTMDPTQGGVSEAVRTIATELAKAGIFNEVLTLDQPATAHQNTMYLVNEIGPSKNRWRYSTSLVPWLIKNLNRFDAIIVHGLWLYPGYAVRKAITKYRSIAANVTCRRVPAMFIMPHGMLDPYFQKTKTRRVKAIRNWAYWKLIESKIVNDSDGLLFTCKQEYLLASQPFKPYKPKNEAIVGLGVTDPPPFDYGMIDTFEALCPNVPFGRYILFFGRIHEKKGVKLLLQAYNHLISSSDMKFIPQLVIAGPGMESSYGLMLEMYVNANPKLKKNIHFLGMLTGRKKLATLYGAEVFILPSHQENFGIAVVEALACGRPVLISNQVNIHSEISQEKAAIVGDDTVEGTYSMLNTWILTSEPDRNSMRFAARRCYEKHFTVNQATSNFLRAIETRLKND